MRICVFGAGSIGGFLAAKLAKAGEEVSVVARGPHLKAMQENGLTLIGLDGERFTVRPHASDDPAALGPQDAVIVSAKAPALPQVAAAIGPLLGPETPVAFAMNGIPWWYAHGFDLPGGATAVARLDPDGALARNIGPERAIGCVVRSGNEVVSPGVVQNTTKNNVYVLGEPDGSTSPRCAAIAKAMNGAGFEAQITDDIRREIWSKLLLNISTATLGVLTATTTDVLVATDDLRDIMRRIMQEGIAVAASHGFDLGIDIEPLVAPGSRGVHKPSMLQDLERGRPMEIDSIASIVQDFGRQAGVPTPTFDIILTLLKARARAAGLYDG